MNNTEKFELLKEKVNEKVANHFLSLTKTNQTDADNYFKMVNPDSDLNKMKRRTRRR